MWASLAVRGHARCSAEPATSSEGIACSSRRARGQDRREPIRKHRETLPNLAGF
jgi:hypothetical protein